MSNRDVSISHCNRHNNELKSITYTRKLGELEAQLGAFPLGDLWDRNGLPRVVDRGDNSVVVQIHKHDAAGARSRELEAVRVRADQEGDGSLM